MTACTLFEPELSSRKWRGTPPSHWHLKRLKWSISGLYNGIWGDEPDGENDILCIRVADFDRLRRSVVGDPPTIRSVKPSYRDRRVLRKGDLLIEKSGGGDNQLVGCVVHFDHDFEAVCSNFVARVPLQEGMVSTYWNYLHSSLYSARLNFPTIKQTTGIQNLDAAAYFDIKVAFPPVQEQSIIANYLDRETASIDGLIAEKERMLALLEEKRTTLISRVVTRGLDAHAPLQAVNAPWFDVAPLSWSVEKLKWVIESVSSGVSVNASDQPVEGDGIGVLKTSAVSGGAFFPSENKSVWDTEYDRLACPVTKNTIIMSRMNTPSLVGESGYVAEDYPNLVLPDRLWKISFIEDRVFVPFMSLLLSSKEARHALSSMATGTSPSMKNLGIEEMSSLLIPVPPLEEQIEIYGYVTTEEAVVTPLRIEIADSLQLLRERRTALITAAVTGQIPVEEMG